MSYCRFGEGDVYMYYHIDGYFTCCGCRFVERNKPDPEFHAYIDAIKHLITHREAGHKVLNHALKRLQEEMEEEIERVRGSHE